MLQEEVEPFYHTLFENTPGRRGLKLADFHDWDSVRYFVKFFNFFNYTIVCIFGSLYCTANLYFNKLFRLV